MLPPFKLSRLSSGLRGLALLCFTAPFAIAAEPEAQVLEGESLKILKHTGSTERQDLKAFGEGGWSGNAHLWWTQAKPGDVLEVEVSVPAEGIYRIGAGLTKAVDYGIFEISLDDKKIAGPMDFFNGGVIHTGLMALGDPLKLAAGEHRLSFKITGANDAAVKAYMLGLDYVIIAPGEKADLVALAPKLKAAKPAGPGVKEGNILDAKPKTPAEQRATFTLPARSSG